MNRANRKVKSNEDLCKDIKEFLSMVGLPQDYVPSTKELSQHGRFVFLFLCGYGGMILALDFYPKYEGRRILVYSATLIIIW